MEDETESIIWTSPSVMAILLGIHRTTVYRRFKPGIGYEVLETRKHPITGKTEIRIPDTHIEKYLNLIK